MKLWKIRHAWSRIREKAMRKVVWALPEKIVYWSAIRVLANATTGPYRNQIVPELNALDALKRWDETHGR